MTFLLTPADERELTGYLCEELGARLLLSDIAPAGVPRAANEPLSALPLELPLTATPGCEGIYELCFWLPDCGPVKTLRNAPEAIDARDRVGRSLTQSAAGDRFSEVIDDKRTPMLRLRRSKMISESRMAPGSLASMPLRSNAVPIDVRRKHASGIRWLKSRGAKLDPFAHCQEVENRRPRNMAPFWVWAQPHAMKLVDQGIEIWPWSA